MGKRKGFDVVADAQELAEHKINPHYWINKVNSYTFARWMAEKKLAIIVAPIYLAAFILIAWNLLVTPNNGGWLDMIGFLLLFGFITLASVIMAVQWLQGRGKKQLESDTPPEKKKQPKRRKDYH